MPKGVLWRQHDIFTDVVGGRTYGTWTGRELDQLAAEMLPTERHQLMSCRR